VRVNVNALRRHDPLASAAAGLVSATGRSVLQFAPPTPAQQAAINESKKLFAEYAREDGRSVNALCASPTFKNLQCGFASDDEIGATIKKQCPLCGTRFGTLPKKTQLPAEVKGGDQYNQYGTELFSLACKGHVVVRSVFKMLEQPATTPEEARSSGWDGADCSNSRMVLINDELISKGGNASPVICCELELPTIGGSNAERALKAKEGKCWVCDWCSEGGGCPSEVGKWYSDSCTTKATGCDFDPQKGYEFHRVGININPQTKILLAKFEVCNSPGCFDPAAEKAKQQAAQPCVKGKCAA
jgi:hypothetical protein